MSLSLKMIVLPFALVDWCVAVAAGVGGAAGQGRRGEGRRRRADAAVININS